MHRVLLVAVIAFGCGKKDDSAGHAPGSAAAPAQGQVAACAKAEMHGDLAWIEDDYAAALACAQAKQLPIVLDLWAPWCHTCLSMKSTVFMDKALTPANAKFVFAALDTDREGNAAAVGKFPLSAWPTFYVIAPDESVLARFAGAASVTQFSAFLDAGLAARSAVDGAAKHLLAAERAIAIKDLATADIELGAAVAAAPDQWARLPDALVSWIHTKRSRKDDAGCLATAETYLDQTGNAASVADFAGISLECAAAVKTTEESRVAAYRDRVAAKLAAQLADTSAPLSTDDRSDAMSYLRELLVDLGKQPDALALAEKQRALLEEAIGKAPNAMAAMTFNYQLADVDTFLARPLDAVPFLEKSAAALPTEYDPAARLGRVYFEAKNFAKAAEWTDKALALVYGPRKARLLELRAQIAESMNDKPTARRCIHDRVALWKTMPAGQQNPAALKKAEEDAAKLDAPPATP